MYVLLDLLACSHRLNQSQRINMKSYIVLKHNDLYLINDDSNEIFWNYETEDEAALFKYFNENGFKLSDIEQICSFNLNDEYIAVYMAVLSECTGRSYYSFEEMDSMKKINIIDYAVWSAYKESYIKEINNKDTLTGLYNQNAYLKCIDELSEHKGENLYIFSIDANGLKIANDTMGHEAGDELLKACGQVMLKVFGDKGKCFRRGGDEFSAIVTGNDADPESYYDKLKKEAGLFRGKYITDMSISVGYSSNVELGVYDIKEIEKTADASMYADKEKFYNRALKNNDYNPDSEEGKFYKLIHDTLELIPAGICMVDISENYSYIRFNTPFMKFFGYDKAEEFSKVSFKDLLNRFCIELDKFDINNRSREYLVKGHKLKVNYNVDREYGEVLYVALYI